MLKGEGEKKHSMSSDCSAIQQNHGRCQPDRHVVIIVSNTVQGKALVPKIFWHLIDMAKTNAWTLYSRHFRQNGKPHKDQKFLLQFSLELSDALILANKDQCRLCSMTCRMQCSKCKISLFLLADCNCFVDFHTEPSSCIGFLPNIKVLVSY